jgi:hypothetical protein
MALHRAIREGLFGLPPIPTGIIQRGRPPEVIELSDPGALQGLLEGPGRGRLTLVEFYGKWCRQCRVVEPVYESLPYA